jgi:hypothetical protein
MMLETECKELMDAELAIAERTIEKLRAERDALLSLLREVSATGGLANELVWDRVDAAIDAARKP